MNDKNNTMQNAELADGQNMTFIERLMNNAHISPRVPVPAVKPLDRVKEAPRKKRSREREER